MLMLSAAVCRSQDKLETVKHNPDKSVWITINGEPYLAITRPQLDAWQILQNNYSTCQKNGADKDVQIKEALLQRDLAEAQKALIQQKAESFEADFKRSQADAARNYGLFIGERTLRQEAQNFIPKGNSHGFWGKTLDLLNSQAGAVAFKLVIPVTQFGKTYFGRCQ